jgi:ATP-binding cassette, subfamily B, bacterial
MNVQILLVIGLGAYMASKNLVVVGTISAFVCYGNMLQFPVQLLGRVMADISKATVAIRRVKEILDSEKEDYDIGKTPFLTGAIEFSNVSHSYDGKHKTLTDVSFKIQKGQSVGIIGPTGAGKTTLVNSLTGIYDCKEGEIKVDKTNVSSIKNNNK